MQRKDTGRTFWKGTGTNAAKWIEGCPRKWLEILTGIYRLMNLAAQGPVVGLILTWRIISWHVQEVHSKTARLKTRTIMTVLYTFFFFLANIYSKHKVMPTKHRYVIFWISSNHIKKVVITILFTSSFVWLWFSKVSLSPRLASFGWGLAVTRVAWL